MVSSKTADFVSHDHRLYIDGKFVPAASGKTFPVFNPATGEVITDVPEAEEEDVESRRSSQRAAPSTTARGPHVTL
jgi:acyl-CoA reductase-like NAD-dependent aldehyde dehydrogenase